MTREQMLCIMASNIFNSQGDSYINRGHFEGAIRMAISLEKKMKEELDKRHQEEKINIYDDEEYK